MVRAIRGATTAESNTAADILSETGTLLEKMIEENDIETEDIISIFFTVTRDLDAAFPATAARIAGLSEVALMCTNEIDVPGSLAKCIRILMHINTDKKNSEMRYVYMKGAVSLRPDLTEKEKRQGGEIVGKDQHSD